MRKGTMVRGRRGKRRDLARLCYQLADKALTVRNGSRVLVVALAESLCTPSTQNSESAESQSHNIRPQSHPVYDAVIIPGGGLKMESRARLQARLKKAWTLRHNTKYFILLSRGTTHASRLDRYRFPIDECKADAQFLYSLGDVDRKKLLLEC